MRFKDRIHLPNTIAGFAPFKTDSPEPFSTALAYRRHDDSEKRQRRQDNQNESGQVAVQCSRTRRQGKLAVSVLLPVRHARSS